MAIIDDFRRRQQETLAPEPAPTITAAEAVAPPAVQPVDETRIRELMQILLEYKAGKSSIDRRVKSAEQWWKLRNDWQEERTATAERKGYRARSAWLHNVITSKHADAMEAYPEPNILPREEGDKAEAQKLSAIVPCVLEQNHFERTYSDAMWSKAKFGTGIYKIIWDKDKLNGLGDISVKECSPLNLFWEPGVEDIQQSRYFFEVDYQDEVAVRELFPQLQGVQINKSVITAEFQTDDHIDMSKKLPVISCYYHKGGVLHYVLFVPGHVLYATENDTQRPTETRPDPLTGLPVQVETGQSMAERGMYDHGKYPYVFDPLFPVEKSPCGYGYVDLCRGPQTEIDQLKTAYIRNAMFGATPRFFAREGSGVNTGDFLDLEKPIVEVPGMVDQNSLRLIESSGLDGSYVAMLTNTIDELRETSGNTDAATGANPSGVTAASAIAALQEASGKGSRDSSMSAYRAYAEIVDFCIELIRQFYDLPRQFRITGKSGEEMFTSYSNQGIQPQQMVGPLGQDMGYRLPVFDIKVQPQKRSAYTKMANNELAIQFFQLGFFNPQAVDQALACLEMMDFDGKDSITQMIQRNGTMYQKIVALGQIAVGLAQATGNAIALQQIVQILGGQSAGAPGMAPTGGNAVNPEDIEVGREPTHMVNARARARGSTMPTEGGGTV